MHGFLVHGAHAENAFHGAVETDADPDLGLHVELEVMRFRDKRMRGRNLLHLFPGEAGQRIFLRRIGARGQFLHHGLNVRDDLKAGDAPAHRGLIIAGPLVRHAERCPAVELEDDLDAQPSV